MGYDAGAELTQAIGLKPPDDPLLAVGVGSIIAEALISHRTGRATSFSLRKGNYVGLQRYHPAMTLRVVRTVVDHLAWLDLIEVEKGKSWAKGGKGKQSRFRAGDLLLDLAGDQPILKPRKGEVLVMKDSDKQLIGFRETERTRAMARDIQAQNEVLESADIRIASDDVTWVQDGFVTLPGLPKGGRIRADITIRSDQTALKRVANNGSWNEGMRYYGHFAQNLPKARRQQLTIGGMPVELLDFGASHPSILYAQAGIFLEGDPYEVDGFDRGEVKLALLILINAGNKREAVMAMAFRLADAEVDEGQVVIVRQDHRDHARRLIAAVEARHEPIKAAFCTGAGTRLQHVEAEIIGAVMKEARKLGIATVPVHDEVIVRANEADRVRDLMVEKWVSACGVFPLL